MSLVEAIVVVGIVAFAAFYLGWKWWPRRGRVAAGGCGSGCGCGQQ